MKITKIICIIFLTLIILSTNVFATLDYSADPNKIDSYEGYDYCMWWKFTGNYAEIAIEIPNLNRGVLTIQLQTVVEYDDFSFDLYLDCTNDIGFGYTRAYKDFYINSNKQLRSISFEFHIFVNNVYQTTILHGFQY